MSYTTGTMSAETATYGGLVDAIGGIATVVLAIVGLAGVAPPMLVAIAIIVFGAALLVQGGTMLSEYSLALSPRAEPASSQPATRVEQFELGGVSALFLVGFAGIVLGVLAVLGIGAAQLTSIAVIAFGAALVISGNAVRQLSAFQTARAQAAPLSGSQRAAGEMAEGSAGVQMLAGLTSAVLGILAVAGTNAVTLTLVALLVLGSSVVLTGSTLSGLVAGFMRAPQA